MKTISEVRCGIARVVSTNQRTNCNQTWNNRWNV